MGAIQRLLALLRGGKSKLGNGLKAVLRSPGFSGLLSNILKYGYIISTIKNRLDQGMTPSRAVIPVIPEMMFTCGAKGGAFWITGLTTGPGAFFAALAGAVGVVRVNGWDQIYTIL